jgi:hypothetical protein
MGTDHFARLAMELAVRHRIPKSTVRHPAGVIVPGDRFMTGKLRDPDYVPYCMGDGCGRTRRVVEGFECPSCGNRMNFDLTHYDGNISVQYEGDAPVLTVQQWNARVDARKAARSAQRGSK